MPRKAPANTHRNRLKRRNEISQGLYRCILNNGYLSTTVRDIAQEAGLNLGLIHHYFDSKEDILVYLMEKIVNQYKEQVKALAAQKVDHPPMERLKSNLETMFKKLSRDKEAYIIFYELFSLSRQHNELNILLRRAYTVFRQEIETLIRDSFVKAGIDTSQIKTVSAFLVSTIEGTGVQWVIDPRSISIPKTAALVNQFIDFYIQQSKRI